MTWGGVLRVTALLALCSTLGGCFFYDSRWGQAKASQKRVAAQRMPSELRAERDARLVATAAPARFKIRAYATRYPDVLPVQELRCQLAMKVGLSMSDERTECARLLQLSGGGLL